MSDELMEELVNFEERLMKQLDELQRVLDQIAVSLGIEVKR